jgi:hypothetical protein
VGYVEYPYSDHHMQPWDWDDAWGKALGFLRRTLYRE